MILFKDRSETKFLPAKLCQKEVGREQDLSQLIQ